MVKSKKMSKTSIAVIVLAILLVLSLCLGLTGAWFTDSVTNSAVPSETLGFGKVDINGEGEASISYTIAEGNTEYLKLVDGDTITVADTLAVDNQSTVAIYYVVDKAFTVTTTGDITAANLTSWLGLSTANNSAKGRLAAGAALDIAGAGAGSYVVNSNGAANGVAGTFQITVTANVYAVQAGNISTDAQLKEAFQAAGMSADAVSEFTLAQFNA